MEGRKPGWYKCEQKGHIRTEYESPTAVEKSTPTNAESSKSTLLKPICDSRYFDVILQVSNVWAWWFCQSGSISRVAYGSTMLIEFILKWKYPSLCSDQIIQLTENCEGLMMLRMLGAQSWIILDFCSCIKETNHQNSHLTKHNYIYLLIIKWWKYHGFFSINHDIPSPLCSGYWQQLDCLTSKKCPHPHRKWKSIMVSYEAE